MNGLRVALLVAGCAGVVALQTPRAAAQWWRSSPADFEQCAEAAEKSATREEKSAALAACGGKFAGRRKPGGGYTYYDFMQDRSFDLAGPNPTPEEQRNIDEQYTLYLENQRRSSIAAAFVKQQQLKLEQAALQPAPAAAEKIPLPHQRPKPSPQQAGPADPRARAREPASCPQHTFSCEWPLLSDGLNELKRLFAPAATKKKS